MNKICEQILNELQYEKKIKRNTSFTFPEPIPLEKKLKDVLEPVVDEKYYLSDKVVASYTKHLERHKERGNGFKFEPTTGNNIAHCISTRAGSRPTDNYISDGVRIRKLTPTEVWKLMGFTKEDCEKASKAGISNSQLCKQAGNSIVVDVLMAILRELLDGTQH